MHVLARLYAGFVFLGLLAIMIGVAQATLPAEPTGGQWKPIVLPSAEAVVVTAPPAANDLQTLRELAAIRARQAQRTPAIIERVRYWDAGGCVRWNEIARALVSKYEMSPPLASRVYALLSVAQYDALVAVWDGKYRYRRREPALLDPAIVPLVAASADPVYPCEAAAIGAASAAILGALFPAEASDLSRMAVEEAESRVWAGVNYPSDLLAGAGVGNMVAALVLARAKTDGADAAWTGTVPTGPGYWYSSAVPPLPPVLPQWGRMRPWLLSDVAALRPPPPPAFGSLEFRAALRTVRQMSDQRTPQQAALARYWADGPGTSTPPGHWNLIACGLITQHGLNELRAARALALLNMAEMDAGICCWDCKYAYWLLRPRQADPAITLAVPMPNFPSYTSGHSSFSGAAAGVLGYLFPADSARLNRMAEDAGISRVYAGIHYLFDNETGLRSGRMVAGYAIAQGKSDGSP